LTSELGTLARRIAEVSSGDAARRGALAKIATEAQAAIKGGDMAAAAAAIGRLRDAMGQPNGTAEQHPLSAARAVDAQAANTRGIAYPKLLLRWREAQAEARGALDRIGEAILAMPDVRADPRLDQVRAVVAELPALIPRFGAELEDLLDRGINAGTDAGIARDARASVGQYRAAVSGAAKLGSFEQFAKQHVGDLAVIGTLDGALVEIAGNLQKAL
jgi:hypothetical protein